MNNNSVEYSWFNLSCIGENVIGQPADSVKFCRFCKKPYKPCLLYTSDAADE